jgi:polyhydroxybutyrate depolymerase
VCVLAAVVVGLTGCGGSDAPSGRRTVRAGGINRTYTVRAPKHLARDAPIFMILHLRQRQVAVLPGFADLPAAARRAGNLVVTPDGVGYSWNAGACCDPAVQRNVDDVGFLRRVIASVRREYGNPKRPVVVVGFSNGAFMAWRLACSGTPLAAIALVEGGAGVDRCRLAGPIDYLQIHQTGDTIVPFGGADHPVIPGAARFPSVGETSARWREAAGCANTPRISASADVQIATYPCAGGSVARVAAVTGGRHDWPVAPEDPLDATKVILRFMDRAAAAPSAPRTP